MNKYIIHCTTEWADCDNDYPAIAEKEEDLDYVAWELAQDNFYDSCSIYDIAEDLFGNKEIYSEIELSECYDSIKKYIGYTINSLNKDSEYNENYWNKLIKHQKPYEC